MGYYEKKVRVEMEKKDFLIKKGEYLNGDFPSKDVHCKNHYEFTQEEIDFAQKQVEDSDINKFQGGYDFYNTSKYPIITDYNKSLFANSKIISEEDFTTNLKLGFPSSLGCILRDSDKKEFLKIKKQFIKHRQPHYKLYFYIKKLISKYL